MKTAEDRRKEQRDEELVLATMRLFSQLQGVRNTFASHWEEIAQLIQPTSRNTFYYGNQNTPGEKKTDKQVDATGMMALSRFGAICDSLLTPRNMTWHHLGSNLEYLMKDRATRLWFEHATKQLFRYRYAPIANFSSQNQNVYQGLGAYGTSSNFIDKPSGGKGLRYKALPLGETFFYENHQGIIVGMVRWFRLTAMQAARVPEWKDSLPEEIKLAAEKNSQHMFDFIHHVGPRDDYDPEALMTPQGKEFQSCWISISGKKLLAEEGYYSFPVAVTRYDQTPGDGPYGRGPAMMVLPALKTLNAQKKVFLKQGHRAADPVLLTADDGLTDGFSLRPGAMNKGGWSSDGKPLIGTLPTGDIQISKEMMADEKALINDAFLVTLFQILTETPTMTATEVIERTNEKGILLAPTVGRQQSEYLGSMIDRELDLLMQQGLIDPMPGLLKEAEGDYTVVYTSPMAKAMRAQEAAGLQRSVGWTAEVVKITGDVSLMDIYDFDVAGPEMADIHGVPPSWMADPEKIAQRRQQRAQAQQKQEQIQAAPAAAAMTKAMVAAKESGALPE